MHDGLPFSKPKVRLLGSPGEAQAYLGEAYNLLYQVRAFCEASGAPVFAMSRNMPDGAIVTAAVIGDEHIVSCTPPNPRGQVERPEPPVKNLGAGGFLFSPHDGSYDDPDENTVRTWSPVFFKTVEYAQSGGLVRTLTNYDPTKVPLIETLRVNSTLIAKPVSWLGVFGSGERAQEAVITWDHGLLTRYRLYPSQDCSGRVASAEGGSPILANSGLPGVCLNGFEIPTAHTAADGFSRTLNVVGAGAFDNRLVIVSHMNLSWRPDPGLTDAENTTFRAGFDSKTATVFYRTGSSWEVAGSFEVDFFLKAPWFFSPDGSEAASLVATSTSVQRVLRIRLSLGDGGVITATIASESLPCDPPYLDTLADPTVRYDKNIPGWQQPGEWTFDAAFWRWDYPTGANDTINAVDYGAYTSWASEHTNQAFADHPSQYKVLYKTGEDTGSALNGTSWDIGTRQYLYDWVVAIQPPPPFVSSQVSAVSVKMYRDTFHKNYTLQNETTHPRDVSGLQYLALDYAADGSKKWLKLRLTAHEDPKAIFWSDDANETATYRPTFTTFATVASRVLRVGVEIGGYAQWDLLCNETVLASIKGGVLGTYSREREHKRVTFSTWGEKPVNQITVTYKHSPADMVVERGWLIDADARTDSCIFEKTTTALTPAEPLDTGTDTGDYGVLQIFSNTGEVTDTLRVVHNGTVVEERTFDRSVGPAATVYAGPAFMQLMPRWYDLEDQIEETHFVQSMDWNIGGVNVTATRLWLLFPYDTKPRALRPGQMQTRYEDFAISTSDETSRRHYAGPLAEQMFAYDREATYFNLAEVRGARYNIHHAVRDAIAADTPERVPNDDIRLFPIKVI